MAVKKKEKRRTKLEGSSVWMGLWACGRADGRAEADDCKKRKKRKKEKERKRKDSLMFRACGWACGRVGMWMRMAVNKKKKEKKEKTY